MEGWGVKNEINAILNSDEVIVEGGVELGKKIVLFSIKVGGQNQ